MIQRLLPISFLTIFLLGLSTSTSAQDTKVEVQIDSILSQLSTEEKIALCHAQSKFSSAGVPGIGIPELWLTDGPHGIREEISWDSWAPAAWTNDSITAFPALTCLAASFDPNLAYEYGRALGEEARYRNKDVLLGPGVNIYRSPLNGRNFEYLGEDPYLASCLAVPYIQGVQSMGVAACVKHFALNNQEKWREHIDVQISDRALHEIYLPAFKAAVQEAEVWSLMGAYNQFRGQHCCHNKTLLIDILKEDWRFDGVVISDWGGTHNTLQAVYHGLDLEMGTWTNGLTSSKANAYDSYFLASPFLEKIKLGEIDEEELNKKARRILRLMMRTSLAPNRPRGKMNNPEHLALAQEVAESGIVLLKNQNQFFPLDTNSDIKIAVIGENAIRSMTQGGGSSALKAKIEISPLTGLIEAFPNAEISFSMGYASGPPVYGKVIASPYDADSLVADALRKAKEADIVLFIGGLNKNHHQDCEGGDRLSFDLPFGQSELIDKITALNPQTAVILISGNAVAMPWLNKVPALVQAWYLGSQSGPALANILSGKVNPSGKLPFSFPKKLRDNAAHSFGAISYPGDSLEQHYLEDILIGYRWHDTKNIPALFPFGFGLSYTQFALSNFKSSTEYAKGELQLIVKCEVRNIGQFNGQEVVQLYVGKANSAVERAQKELKGFQKVNLKAGETKNLVFKIPLNSLMYYDEKSSAWTLEEGPYQIYLGQSSVIKEAQLSIELQNS